MKNALRETPTLRALAVVRFGHRPLSQIHRHDRLQYTAPQLDSAQCNDAILQIQIVPTPPAAVSSWPENVFGLTSVSRSYIHIVLEVAYLNVNALYKWHILLSYLLIIYLFWVPQLSPHCALSQWPIRVTTLRASEAAAQCIVTGPVCFFVVVWMCVFVGLLPPTRNCVHRSSPNWVCR